ncbi:type IV secretion system DNA-binding domain-containing protein [Thermodesulfovibrio sp. 3462-1]|uniref:Type IV secretion system DNA-binding domain-containing protein n=1 Tax=Thermodesulfovibrio obliviosus TaxID=3118332 RepID=A0AAU8H1S2_9BACT
MRQEKQETFKGFETWLSALKMRAKMVTYVTIAFLFAHMVITLLLSYIMYRTTWSLVIKYAWSSLSHFTWPSALLPALLVLLKKSIWIFAMSFWLWLLFPFAIRYFKHRAEKQAEDVYIRGARVLDRDEIQRMIKEECDLPLGSFKMPVSAEVKHMFIVGRPGVGKTVALSQVIERLKERKVKGVIYDFKGDYVSKFYDPSTDILFNPLDTRCLGWNIFNEISTHMDIDAVAHSLIPPPYMADPFWNDAARDVFAGILHYLWQNNAKTNMDIWNAVTAPGGDIAIWLKNTKGGERGYRYIEDASSKQAMSVFAVMMQYVKSFEFMARAGGDFSIRRWLEDPQGGFIFITSYSDIKDTLRPILSLFLDLMGRKLLSLPDDLNRRIFFIIDEFGTLQRLSTIVQLLTLSRSKGGSVWVGIQDVGQLDKIYTPALRQAIVNACGSNLVFSVADPETARFLSEKIGEAEVIRPEEGYSMGPEDMRDGISIQRRRVTEKVVLPSELQNIPDLTAFLKLPNYPWTQTKFTYKHYPTKNPSFIMKPDFVLDMQAIKEPELEEKEC